MTRARLIIAAIVIVAIVAAVGCVRRSGERAGADRVTVQAERDHSARAIEARTDERAAAATSATIAARTARADALTDAYVRQTIEDLRNAIETAPPVAAGDPIPAAPVDRVRDTLNAGIARAARSADAADAIP